MRKTPKKEPPQRPETRCDVCGTTEVVGGGIPLCEVHDSKIARKRIRMDARLHQLGEDKVEIMKRMERVNEETENVRQRLDELRVECDHENVQVSSRAFTDGKSVKECPDCGWETIDGDEDLTKAERLEISEGDLLSRRRKCERLLQLSDHPVDDGETVPYASLSVYRGDDHLMVRDIDGVSSALIRVSTLPDGSEEQIEELQQQLDKIHFDTLS
jgi:ribosomal protein S14